ncbi:MAG: site-specific integrase [Bacteroidota bacterium]
MENKATIAVIADKRSQKKDGTHPVKLRVIYMRETRYFSTGLAVSSEDWDKIVARKARGTLKEIQDQVVAIESKAYEVAASIGAFTLNRFQDAYNGLPVQQEKEAEPMPKLRTVYDVFEVYIADLRATDRAGTASSYNTAKISLRKFCDKLYFEDVTPKFLEKYQKAMTGEGTGNSLTTVGMYLRALRTIFNYAIEKGIVMSNFYPFGKRKYQIPTGANVKKALTRADVLKITNYVPKYPDTWEEQARDLWLLSYACNGMNIKDLCNLKYSSIKGNKIFFIRQKTERTTRSNPKPVIAHLPEIAVKIIERWGQKPKHPDSYIFPFYEAGMDAERRFVVSKQIVHNINRWMKSISAELGIEVPVTTYTARHTFSTVLKRSGASIEFISESLGHTDVRTTESYLADFDDELREEMSKRLFE